MLGNVQNRWVIFILLAVTMLLVACGDSPPELRLETARAKAQQCVEPTDEMRKNHMELILHQRDETVHNGIRTSRHSFKECINCHIPASDATGKPVNYLTDEHDLNTEHFCATCHAYVGVKLDCFECHSDNPQSSSRTRASTAAPTDSTHASVSMPFESSFYGGVDHE